jgi:hypothetical protein
VPQTRVLIFSMPRLLNEILGSVLRDDADVTVIQAPVGFGSLADAATLARADVVIAAEHDSSPAEVSALLEDYPHAHVLTVADDGRSGVLYELLPHRRVICDLSVDSVRWAIRHAARRSDRFFPDSRPAR